MDLRQDNIQKLQSQAFDVLIIGGGINGAVSAASLAARGLKVAMIDRADFASECSSNSSNLVWGGIKYLESGELFLVSKLCRSRNHLMRQYPSSVKEIRFLASIKRDFRLPVWFVYLGTVFYWLIGACFTRAPQYLGKQSIADREAIVNVDDVVGGVEYSDCYLPDNDARFVFKFIRAALDFSCVLTNYVEALNSRRDGGEWITSVRDLETQVNWDIKSKVLINCCGPYVDHYNQLIGQHTKYRHLFSKGIHLIVDRLSDCERILTFFASDGRMFFVIPMGPKTCIGTTDTPVQSPTTHVTEADRTFILENVNRLLKLPQPLTVQDIIAERCGVRPLVTLKRVTQKRAAKKRVTKKSPLEKSDTDHQQAEDWVKLSRKHEIEINAEDSFISVFGGKMTDCINVGEEIAEILKNMLGDDPQFESHFNREPGRWFGEPVVQRKQKFLRQAQALQLDQLTPASSHECLSERFWRRYGERAFLLLDRVRQNPETATQKPIEAVEYCRCELELIANTEMVTRLDDFLRRRSKIAQVLRARDFIDAPGLTEICRILFAERAQEKLIEYRAYILSNKEGSAHV